MQAGADIEWVAPVKTMKVEELRPVSKRPTPMTSARRAIALIAFAAIAIGCSSTRNDSTSSAPPQQTSEATDSLPPTAAARSSTTTIAVKRDCPRADVVDVGDCIEVDTTGAIYLGDDVFIAERPIASKPNDRLWERTDFPAEWDVEILNEAPQDGSDWIIRNVHATRVDDDTLEVVEPTTGDFVGRFLRDERPPEERPQAG